MRLQEGHGAWVSADPRLAVIFDVLFGDKGVLGMT